MPIFISYSHQDREFVDKLAKQLVAARHNVWMDRWELSLGDSLTQKIESALTGAGAILVIVSKNSIASDWFKRELSAGLVRELEEKKTLVMPCVIDDCDVPLFLRDKLYADFRRDPDGAFQLVDRSLARISNPLQDRIEDLKFHTDWAVTWETTEEGRRHIKWTFIEHGHEWPYVILTLLHILCDEVGSAAFKAAAARDARDNFIGQVLGEVLTSIKGEQLNIKITDPKEHVIVWKVDTKGLGELGVIVSCQRLGIDNGMDTLVHVDPKLKSAHDQMMGKLLKPKGS